MTDTPINPLRQRMIEDMKARKLTTGTQTGHIRSCRRFAAFLKRSPETATADDIRLFQLHLAETGISISNRNRTMTGLRFLFRVTLRRPDLAAEIFHVREPQKIPLVMSPDETPVCWRWPAASRPAWLSASVMVAACARRGGQPEGQAHRQRPADHPCRAGQRAQGSSCHAVARDARSVAPMVEGAANTRRWANARAGARLFPGRKAGRPMTTRQLNRLFHEAADAAGITKAVTLHSLRHSFATHLLDRGVDIRIIQALLGHEKLDTTARYTRVATGTIAGIESPLDLLEPRRRRTRAERTGRRRNRPRPCPVPHWRSRTSSATTARRGVAPTPVTSASAS